MIMETMSYIFDFHTARAYEQWTKRPEIRKTEALELALMMDMIQPVRGKTVLGVCCRTGSVLVPFIEKGLMVTGIDPSPYMLDIAKRRFGNRADFHRGFGEDLPFEDNSFHYVCLNIALEFSDDYHKVMEEACRVAKDKVYVGLINRYSLNGYKRRSQCIFSQEVLGNLHYFSAGEIKRKLCSLLGNVPVNSRTIFHFPIIMLRILHRIEISTLMQYCPFGAYAGITATLLTRFNTRPLVIEYQPAAGTARPVPG